MWTDADRDGVQDTGETVTGIGYDAEGNNTLDAQGQTLVYDAWNRMAAIKVGETVKIAYEYDGLFRRIQEAVGETVHSQYYSASWQVIEERVGSEVRVQNVWSAVYIDAMVLRDRDADANGTLEERVYPLFDANFNVSSLVWDVDPTTEGFQTEVFERYRYEPYGDRVVLNADFTPDTLAGSDSTTSDDTEAGWNTSDVLFRHGHQGGAYDRVASEKMLFRFRTLDTQQMRWGQVDPLRYVDGMNAYEVVGSSPTTWFDPLGLSKGRAGAHPAAPAPRLPTAPPVASAFAPVASHPGLGSSALYNATISARGYVPIQMPPNTAGPNPSAYRHGVVNNGPMNPSYPSTTSGGGLAMPSAAYTSGQFKPNFIPRDWTGQPADAPGHVWGNPHSFVRFMEGKIKNRYPESREPYVRVQYNGHTFDLIGNQYPTPKVPGTHVPIATIVSRPDGLRVDLQWFPPGSGGGSGGGGGGGTGPVRMP
jgi:RHS repeat-associated protein